jgi:5'-3' exonuclease
MFPRELEADDVIAFLCDRLEGKKVIVSVDKDFLQLICSSTTLYDPIRKEEYNSENFKEKTGWGDTFNWLNAKCILGDKSDNVPGVPKFGKAKIERWLKNEIQLTEEQFSIFKRNLSLFSLDTFHYRPEEKEYYETQLNSNIESNWKAFLNECQERKFNSFLNKKEAWYTLFFIKNKLQSIFS